MTQPTNTTPWILAAALAATIAGVPGIAAAQLDAGQAKCVTTMHKDGAKVASARAKQVAACFAGAQDGSVSDLGACLDAADASVDAAVAKSDADAMKACGYHAPEFGLPASYDDTVSESGIVHAAGLLKDLLGATPVAATGADGKCQAAALKTTQKFVDGYRKAFGKCVGAALKEGAAAADALLPCLAPDLSAARAKASDAIQKACGSVSPATALPGECSGAAAGDVGQCLVRRSLCRACREAATDAALDANCDLVDNGVEDESCSFPVTASGNAFNFWNYDRIQGAAVWILEHPELGSVMTDADGYFEFPGLQEGEEVSFVLEHADFHPLQNGTIRLGPSGAARVSFQAVTWDVYDALAFVIGVTPDEGNKCQMVTTVTRVGKSIYDPGAHGEGAATVTISPTLPAENGPIYFNSDVLPQPSLTRTSDDGGTLYIQVTTGEYVWTAHKGDLVFTRIKSKCRAGLLVNASPPWGLQRH